jgi:hypothetical protein
MKRSELSTKQMRGAKIESWLAYAEGMLEFYQDEVERTKKRLEIAKEKGCSSELLWFKSEEINGKEMEYHALRRAYEYMIELLEIEEE